MMKEGSALMQSLTSMVKERDDGGLGLGLDRGALVLREETVL